MQHGGKGAPLGTFQAAADFPARPGIIQCTRRSRSHRSSPAFSIHSQRACLVGRSVRNGKVKQLYVVPALLLIPSFERLMLCRLGALDISSLCCSWAAYLTATGKPGRQYADNEANHQRRQENQQENMVAWGWNAILPIHRADRWQKERLKVVS